MGTKENMSCEALNLFSEKGFDSVSARDVPKDVPKAVGIKDSSLKEAVSAIK